MEDLRQGRPLVRSLQEEGQAGIHLQRHPGERHPAPALKGRPVPAHPQVGQPGPHRWVERDQGIVIEVDEVVVPDLTVRRQRQQDQKGADQHRQRSAEHEAFHESRSGFPA